MDMGDKVKQDLYSENKTLVDQGLKRCYGCRQIKPQGDFSPKSRQWDGYNTRCKACENAYKKSRWVYKRPHVPPGQKRCFTCNEVKPLEEFNKNQRRCKPCQRAINRSYIASEAGRTKRKNYNQSDVGKAVMRKAVQNAKARNPEAYKARVAVNNAVRSGKLRKVRNLTCALCNAPAAHYHHYKGYDRVHWLTVQPVCIACHKSLT